MALDWGILHWIQNNITCPFLDAAVRARSCWWVCSRDFSSEMLRSSISSRARGPAGSIPPCSF